MYTNLLFDFAALMDTIQENLVLFVVLAAIAVLIVALLIVLIALSVKAKKAKKAEEAAPANEEAASPAEQPTAAAEEPAPVAAEEPTPAEEVKEEPAPAPVEEPAPIVDEPTPIEEEVAAEEKEEVTMKKEPTTEEKKPAKRASSSPYVYKPGKTEPAPAPAPAPAKTAANGKWVIEEVKGRYWFSLYANNGQVMLESSTPYATVSSARSGIKTYQDNIAAGRLEITEHKNGDFQVNILNGRGALLATSSTYNTRTDCEKALESIKRWATSTAIEEAKND